MTTKCLNTACRKPLSEEKIRPLSGFCWACEQAKPQVSAQQAKVLMNYHDYEARRKGEL